MKRFHYLYRLRRLLLAPLIYLAALLLILEDWLWDLGARLMGQLARLPLLRQLEAWIQTLRPRNALLLFMLPAVLLFPVKLLALYAMAHGHALLGVSVIIAAKVAGAAAVARLYLLTRPLLMTIVWFARLLGWFVPLKERWIARLRASKPWREIQALLAAVRGRLRALRPAGRRSSARLLRILRRFTARWRARNRP
ncbi:hypothetical protein HSX11_07550 [Oxalobacteraceae bacterium]|nr:hypothetical protein [Oxalobacteraceae bacterium]